MKDETTQTTETPMADDRVLAVVNCSMIVINGKIIDIHFEYNSLRKIIDLSFIKNK